MTVEPKRDQYRLPTSVAIRPSLFETGIIRNLDTTTHTALRRFLGSTLGTTAGGPLDRESTSNYRKSRSLGSESFVAVDGYFA